MPCDCVLTGTNNKLSTEGSLWIIISQAGLISAHSDEDTLSFCSWAVFAVSWHALLRGRTTHRHQGGKGAKVFKGAWGRWFGYQDQELRSRTLRCSWVIRDMHLSCQCCSCDGQSVCTWALHDASQKRRTQFEVNIPHVSVTAHDLKTQMTREFNFFF